MMQVLDQVFLLIVWVALNVLLALIPVVITISLSFFFNSSGSPVNWIQILREGELFLFSTTISANAISKMILPSPGDADVAGKIALIPQSVTTIKAFNLVALALMLLFSTFMFGASSMIKVYNVANVRVAERRYVMGAFGCAIASSCLSYWAFVQGGMK
jgi:hypothetical protein